jgi:hypothetical protein
MQDPADPAIIEALAEFRQSHCAHHYLNPLPPTRVIIESPYRGGPASATYLKHILRACLLSGWAPYASHAIYPIVLDDATPAERAIGMQAGLAWHKHSTVQLVFLDLGLTPGMVEGINHFRQYTTGTVYNCYVADDKFFARVRS